MSLWAERVVAVALSSSGNRGRQDKGFIKPDQG